MRIFFHQSLGVDLNVAIGIASTQMFCSKLRYTLTYLRHGVERLSREIAERNDIVIANHKMTHSTSHQEGQEGATQSASTDHYNALLSEEKLTIFTHFGQEQLTLIAFSTWRCRDGQ